MWPTRLSIFGYWFYSNTNGTVKIYISPLDCIYKYIVKMIELSSQLTLVKISHDPLCVTAILATMTTTWLPWLHDNQKLWHERDSSVTTSTFHTGANTGEISSYLKIIDYLFLNMQNCSFCLVVRCCCPFFQGCQDTFIHVLLPFTDIHLNNYNAIMLSVMISIYMDWSCHIITNKTWFVSAHRNRCELI